MTTILADFALGLMVADTCVSDGDRIWTQRKVFRHRGALLGFSGEQNESVTFMTWWRSGCVGKPPKFVSSSALVLTASGLVEYSNSCVPVPAQSGSAAIGSGGKAAMCAYHALGYQNPAKAVAIVCKFDLASRKPIRTYKL